MPGTLRTSCLSLRVLGLLYRRETEREWTRVPKARPPRPGRPRLGMSGSLHAAGAQLRGLEAGVGKGWDPGGLDAPAGHPEGRRPWRCLSGNRPRPTSSRPPGGSKGSPSGGWPGRRPSPSCAPHRPGSQRSPRGPGTQEPLLAPTAQLGGRGHCGPRAKPGSPPSRSRLLPRVGCGTPDQCPPLWAPAMREALWAPRVSFPLPGHVLRREPPPRSGAGSEPAVTTGCLSHSLFICSCQGRRPQGPQDPALSPGSRFTL